MYALRHFTVLNLAPNPTRLFTKSFVTFSDTWFYEKKFVTFSDTRNYKKKFVTFFDTPKYKQPRISRHAKIQTAAHFSTREITKKLCDISRHAKIQTAAHFSTRAFTNGRAFLDTRNYKPFFRANVANYDFVFRHAEIQHFFPRRRGK